MNREQFLSKLDYHLRRLPQSEREEALRYYDEYISDAENEAEAIASLGSPGKVAAQIIAAWAEVSSEPGSQKAGDYSRYNGAHTKSRNGFKAFWIVLLAVFATPIALPLALSIAAVAVALLVVLIAVVFSIAVAGLALLFSGVVYIVYSFINIIGSSFSAFLLVLGTGLAAAGIGAVLIMCVRLIAKYGIGGLIKMLSRQIKRR